MQNFMITTLNQLMDLIAELRVNNPSGFTYDLKAGKLITSGYSFSYAETQNSFGVDGIKKVAEFILTHNVPVVGGWFNEADGQFYFDASVVVNSLAEAVEYGRANGQLAVYDLNNGIEVSLIEVAA